MPRTGPQADGVELALTISQMALASGYSARRIRQVVEDGEMGDYFRLDGRIRVPMGQYIAWRQKRKVRVQ